MGIQQDRWAGVPLHQWATEVWGHTHGQSPQKETALSAFLDGRPRRANSFLPSVVQVRSHLDSKVTVSYSYIIQDHIRSSLESNLVQEEAVVYEWALKKWSHCSKPCGGGLYAPIGVQSPVTSLTLNVNVCCRDAVYKVRLQEEGWWEDGWEDLLLRHQQAQSH